MSWVKRARILPKGDVLVACAQAIFEEDLMHMCLSRSSYLYRFVFGRRPHGMHGFPEPWLDRMPLGVFCCLFAGMVVLRP
ncbi:MAG: hypothetical protein KBE09_05580, partial [Candidatus Pacebacteria bacterium]|nr:hypothetical protein [Candidatus Paceibacterota bacterium]